MSEVSLLITTNRKFYVNGDVDDIIYQIQHETTDGQTGEPSKWFCFYRLVKGEVLNSYQPLPALKLNYITCWRKGEKTAVKKTAIKSVIGIDDDALFLSSEEIETINNKVRNKYKEDIYSW